MTNSLMTTEQLSSALKLTPYQLRRFRDNGLPHVFIGRAIMYNPLQVQEWLALHGPGAPELLTTSDLTSALHASISKIRRLRKAGLPTVYVGRYPRFVWRDVLKWLEERSATKDARKKLLQYLYNSEGIVKWSRMKSDLGLGRTPDLGWVKERDQLIKDGILKGIPIKTMCWTVDRDALNAAISTEL